MAVNSLGITSLSPPESGHHAVEQSHFLMPVLGDCSLPTHVLCPMGHFQGQLFPKTPQELMWHAQA